VLLDGLSGSIAAILATWLRFELRPTATYLVVTLLAPITWTGVVAAQRGYERRFLGVGPDEYRRLADATLVLFALAAVLSFAFKGEFSRGVLALFLPAVFLFSFLSRARLRRWLFRRRLAGNGMQRVLVVGRTDSVRHLADQLRREPWHGLVPVAACVPEASAAEPEQGNLHVSGAVTIHGADEVTVLRAVAETEADVVAVASNPDLSGHALRRLAWSLDELDVDLVVSPGIVEVAGPRLSIRPIAGLSLLHLERPTTRGGRILIKTLLDRALALLLLAFISPAMLVVALAVKCTSAGPVLFRQARIGVSGRPFTMLKFRSMVIDAEERREELEKAGNTHEVLFKIRDDPRITRVGSVLRRFSIDELPQLWNVLRGEMSLVGPRPPLPQEAAGYSDDATRRLRVRPGMTGLWQVSGRSDLSWEESLRLDLRYVDNWSLILDATILWRTWRAVLGRAGAY
jgi:exopolysaccharide biosynthesis polyprenyl glycosylphosphotransferase